MVSSFFKGAITSTLMSGLAALGNSAPVQGVLQTISTINESTGSVIRIVVDEVPDIFTRLDESARISDAASHFIAATGELSGAATSVIQAQIAKSIDVVLPSRTPASSPSPAPVVTPQTPPEQVAVSTPQPLTAAIFPRRIPVQTSAPTPIPRPPVPVTVSGGVSLATFNAFLVEYRALRDKVAINVVDNRLFTGNASTPVARIGDTSTQVFGSVATFSGVSGAGLSSCSGSNFLQWSSGLFSCGAAGGGSVPRTEASGVTILANSSIFNFDDGVFDVAASGSTETVIKLDWINGPASRSATQNITGLWTFGNVGSATFAGSVDIAKSVTSTKSVTATNFRGTAAVSSSFAGSLNTTLGIHATTDVSANGRFLGIGTGSNSFAGSLNTSKSLTATNSVTASNFRGTTATSSSFAGSLNTTLGIHANGDVTGAGRFIGTSAGSNSFSGSLTISKGLTVSSNVGIGATNVSAKLEIKANTITTDNIASISATGLTTGNVFQIIVPASTSANNANGLMLVQNVNGLVIASWSMGGKLAIRGAIFSHGGQAGCTGVNVPAGCIDYAESFPTTDSTLGAGEVVAVDPAMPAGVVRATNTGKIVGIISTNPAALIDDNAFKSGATTEIRSPGTVPIALAGRVPVKISLENGPIQPGDHLTVSATIPGSAMKQTAAGTSLGVALEQASEGSSMVLTLVRTAYWAPDIAAVVLNDAPTPSLLASIFTSVVNMFKDVLNISFGSGTIELDQVILKDKTSGSPYCLHVDNGQLIATACATPTPIEHQPSPEANQPLAEEASHPSAETPSTEPTPEDQPETGQPSAEAPSQDPAPEQAPTAPSEGSSEAL